MLGRQVEFRRARFWLHSELTIMTLNALFAYTGIFDRMIIQKNELSLPVPDDQFVDLWSRRRRRPRVLE